MYTHMYPAKVLYIHNPKYFCFKVNVWPNDLQYRISLNLLVEENLWSDWDTDEETKKEYIDFLVKSLRNRVVFIDVTAGDRVSNRPRVNMYIPCAEGTEIINSHPTMIYPHFLEEWKKGNPISVANLVSQYGI